MHLVSPVQRLDPSRDDCLCVSEDGRIMFRWRRRLRELCSNLELRDLCVEIETRRERADEKSSEQASP
ncbi:unnamed protein product [Cochlearia groenlandica]